MKTQVFFISKKKRTRFIDNYLYEKNFHKQGTMKEQPKEGITLIKLRNSFKGVPGYWLLIFFEDSEKGETLFRQVKKNLEKERIPEDVFYPKKSVENKVLINNWFYKYEMDSKDGSMDKWKIFYQELRNHFKQGRISEAYTGLNLILKYCPEFLKKYRRYSLYEEIALKFEEHGSFKRAEKAIKKPLYLNINSEEPYLNLCAFYMLHGMEDKAFKVGDFALKRFPKNVYVLCNQAVILATLDNYDDAMKILTEAEKNGLTDPLLYKTKGELLADLERDPEAVRTFRKGLKRTQKGDRTLRIELLSDLGESYIHMKEFTKATKVYERILREDPKDLYHLLRLVGTNFYELKDYDQALKYGEILIREEPGMSSYHYLLGLIRMERNELELAQWHLYKAKQLMPTHPLIEEELRELRVRKKFQRKTKETNQS